jgi:uncharacterized protein YoxC
VANWVIAGALFVFIIVVLVTLKRVERNRDRKPGD